MNKSKIVLSIISTFLCVNAFAQMGQRPPEGQKEENFAQVKQKKLQRLSEHQACVSASKNFDDLIKCRPERPRGAPDGRRGFRPMDER